MTESTVAPIVVGSIVVMTSAALLVALAVKGYRTGMLKDFAAIYFLLTNLSTVWFIEVILYSIKRVNSYSLVGVNQVLWYL